MRENNSMLFLFTLIAPMKKGIPLKNTVVILHKVFNPKNKENQIPESNINFNKLGYEDK